MTKENKDKKNENSAQNKLKEWKRYLIILHAFAITILLSLGILLVFLIINQTSGKDKKPGESIKESQLPFFEPGSVYYVKTNLIDKDQLEFIVGLQKNLKRDKESVENSLKSLKKLDDISGSEKEKDAKQYFFYKPGGDDDKIYTFVKLKKPQVTDEEKVKKLAVEIDLNDGKKQNPTTWMKFTVERQVNQPGVEFFSIELSEETKFHRREFIKTGGKLNDIVNEYVEELNYIVSNNPGATKKNWKTLKIEFNLPGDSKHQKATIILKDRLKPDENDKERFVLKDEKEVTNKIEEALKRFFKEEKGAVVIYIDGEKIMTSTDKLDDVGEKVSVLLGSIDFNSFKEWEPPFQKSGTNLNFHRLVEYIKEKKAKLLQGPVIEKEGDLSRQVINTGIAFIGVFIIYILLWTFCNSKIRSYSQMEGETSKDLGWQAGDGAHEILLDAKQTTGLAPITVEHEEQKSDTATETATTESEKEAETTESVEEKPMKFRTIELKKMQVKKISGLLKELHQRAIDGFNDAVNTLFESKAEKMEVKINLDKLNAAKNLVKEILKIKPLDTNQEVFNKKLNLLHETLIDFKEENKDRNINGLLEELEKEFEMFETPGIPELPEEELSLPGTEAVPTAVPPVTTVVPIVLPEVTEKIDTANEKLDKIEPVVRDNITLLRFTSRFFKRLIKKFNNRIQKIANALKNSLADEEEKKDFDFDHYLVKLLKLPDDNKELFKKLDDETKRVLMELANDNKQLLEQLVGDNKRLLEQLADDNQGFFTQLDKKVDEIIKDSRYEARFYRMMDYINKETYLKVDKTTVLDILDKVEGEPAISKDYRLCAVKLFEELEELIKSEEKHQDTWYWKLLADGFFNELKKNINVFSLKNEEAKDLYEHWLKKKDTPLRHIKNEDIRKIIEQHHWVQIWDVLIRMSDFFAAYLGDEADDINDILCKYAKEIEIILKKLGYKIIHIKPLTEISPETREQMEIEESDKSYTKGVILKNLVERGNKRLRHAAENISADNEMVVYVERLGLENNIEAKPVKITNLRIGAYNKRILHSFIKSWDSNM